jgi:acyl-CoA thioesterase
VKTRTSPKKPRPRRYARSSDELGLINYRHPDQFGEWLGYRVLRINREKHVAETALEIREDHLSPAGRVHGGVISAFFDYSCGAAVFSTLGESDFCSTVELKVNYFKPIYVGDELTALVRVIFRGKRLCVVHGYIYRNGEKAPVSMATATFNVVQAKDEKKKKR